MLEMMPAYPSELAGKQYRGLSPKCESCLNTHFLLMFQAFLDSFSHPVWLNDGAENVLANASARRLAEAGFSLAQASAQVESGERRKLAHDNIEYSVGKQSIVHGSCYTLCELLEYVDTESADRLRQSTEYLRKVLAGQACQVPKGS